MSLMLLYGYGSIALCLLAVAAHDIARWADRRRTWDYLVTMEYTQEVRQ